MINQIKQRKARLSWNALSFALPLDPLQMESGWTYYQRLSMSSVKLKEVFEVDKELLIFLNNILDADHQSLEDAIKTDGFRVSVNDPSERWATYRGGYWYCYNSAYRPNNRLVGILDHEKAGDWILSKHNHHHVFMKEQNEKETT